MKRRSQKQGFPPIPQQKEQMRSTKTRIPPVVLLGLYSSVGMAQTPLAPVTTPIPSSPPPALPNCGPNPALRLTFAGDVYVGKRSQPILEAGAKLAESLTPVVVASDALIANLEGPITTATARAFPDQRFTHRMDPSVTKLLGTWGVRGVTLANNHSMDFGTQGMTDTKAALNAAGIHSAGAGNNWIEAEAPMVFEKSGIKVHVLSFNATFPEAAWAGATTPGVAYPFQSRLRERIQASAKEADYVAVAFHWGTESERALRDYQPILANMALDAGAQFVYGHHVHIAQAIKHTERGTVAFGLGNFVFDSYSHKAGFGLAAVVTICKRSPAAQVTPAGRTPTPQPAVVFVPLNTNNFVNKFMTRPMTKAEFLKASADYIPQGDFPKETLFWLPTESKISTLSDWLKP